MVVDDIRNKHQTTSGLTGGAIEDEDNGGQKGTWKLVSAPMGRREEGTLRERGTPVVTLLLSELEGSCC